MTILRTALLMAATAILVGATVTAQDPCPSAAATALAPHDSSCYLVTDDEMSSITGHPTIYPSAGGWVDGMMSCVWLQSLDPVSSVSMYWKTSDGYEAVGDALTGLGDKASWNGSMLIVVKGDNELIILPSGGSDPEAEAIAIARLALSRLP